jgi:hypothetical protein
MPFKASRLQHDQLTLNRAKINTARLKPEQVREGAAILRKLISSGAVANTASEDAAAWSEWRERVRQKGV